MMTATPRFGRFSVMLGLLALAVLGSVIHRGTERRWTPARVGEHWVLEGDVHVHTSFAGAVSTPVDIPLVAQRRQLDFVAITEHNAWFGGAVTRALARVLAPDLIVLPSEEITNRAYHLLAIGLERRVDPTLPLSAIADDVHAQGGVVVAAHPTRDTWPLLLGLAAEKKLDGAEVFHPTIFLREGRAREHAEFLVEASHRAGAPLAAFGSSDYHGGSRLGTSRTIVLARERTAASILEAIKAGRVVAVTNDGRTAGDPRWIQALADAGIASRAADPHNVDSPGAHAGVAERIVAGVTLFGLVLALLRRAPISPPPRPRSRSRSRARLLRARRGSRPGA
jgi:predicted metal-dependent phosphoesterase TrpH